MRHWLRLLCLPLRRRLCLLGLSLRRRLLQVRLLLGWPLLGRLLLGRLLLGRLLLGWPLLGRLLLGWPLLGRLLLGRLLRGLCCRGLRLHWHRRRLPGRLCRRRGLRRLVGTLFFLSLVRQLRTIGGDGVSNPRDENNEQSSTDDSGHENPLKKSFTEGRRRA